MILPGAKCRFYPGNAASGEFARSNMSYRSINAFEKMFEDRTESNLQINMTTNPQAEILFEGIIPISAITDAWVEDEMLGKEIDRFFIEEAQHEIDVLIAPIYPRHSNRYPCCPSSDMQMCRPARAI